jgi:hypothetical protein
MKKYRVREHRNKFYIETFVEENTTKGILWCKNTSKSTEWVRCAESGGQSYYFSRLGIRSSPPIGPFDDLKSATEYIHILLKPDIIHYV